MKPELYLSDALGAVGKPMFRVHTAGSVGGTTAIVAASHVQAGKHRTVLAVAFEKQSEGNAQFALGSGKGASLGAGGAFAPFIRAYIHRSGAPEHIGWKVAVKDRLNALKNPYAHLQHRGHLHREGEGVPDDVGADPVPRVVPVVGRRLRGGAHRQAGGEAAAADGRPPAWMLGRIVALGAAELPGSRPGAARGRACSARRTSTRMAGITRPREQIDMAELYVPFSWHEAIWLEAHGIAEPGDGLEDDRRRLDRARRALPGQLLGWGAVAQPHRGVRACCGSPRPPTRCAARPASTRWTGPRWRWPWPTAPTASTSAPGWWAPACIRSTDRRSAIDSTDRRSAIDSTDRRSAIDSTEQGRPSIRLSKVG